MRRREVLRTLRKAADDAGLDYREADLTNHLGVTVGAKRSTIGRHTEVDDITRVRFYKQFEEVLGKGWWR